MIDPMWIITGYIVIAATTALNVDNIVRSSTEGTGALRELQTLLGPIVTEFVTTCLAVMTGALWPIYYSMRIAVWVRRKLKNRRGKNGCKHDAGDATANTNSPE